MVRLDNSIALINSEFSIFLHQKTCAYSSQQNEVEMMYEHLLQVTMAHMSHPSYRINFGGKAFLRLFIL